MKKTITALASMVFLASCHEPERARENVENEFPKAKKIVVFQKWEFIVIDSNCDVWKVKCLNSANDDISYRNKVYSMR